MSARDTALMTLAACRRQNAWSDGALKQRISADGLDRRDAALATRLCYGVLQNRMLLDTWISCFLRGSLSSLQPIVLDILRLAVYQLRMTDKVPASAAVNEAVEQAKARANPRAAGLVNGVLRSMLREPEKLSMPEELHLRCSHPKDLVDLLRENVGADRLEPLLRCHNEMPPTFVQVNSLRASAEEVLEGLLAEGFEAEPHPWLQDCLQLRRGSVEQSEAFRNGLIYVQDPAARLAVLAAGPAAGSEVLDCCAAPGGKSLAAAIAMGDRGSILSCDLHPHKIELIRKNAERMQLHSITARTQDASIPVPEWKDRFHLVLADVPCSGLGVIRKKPDIRYKPLAEMERLPEIQSRILEAQSGHVRPGGVLLYSTCTILRRENEDVVSAFLAAHSEYAAEPFALPGDLKAPEGLLTLLPCDHGTDGFFIAKLRRKP